jgi:hypothetical protein
MKLSQLFRSAALALAAAFLGGCASTPAPDKLAANDSRECKIVSYASVAESDAAATRDMRRATANSNTPAERALAASEVGKLQVDKPRRFGRPATEPNLLSDARRDC